jgi:PAS domain S-box-containing protein
MPRRPGHLESQTPRHQAAQPDGVLVCLSRSRAEPLMPKNLGVGRCTTARSAPGQQKRWRPRQLVFFLLGVVLLFKSAAPAQVKEVRRVLILNVLGYLSSPGVAQMDDAIVAGLENSPYQIELYSEDMEETLFPDEVSQRQFQEWYIRKYRDRKPDVIIAAGLEPLKFMVASHEEFFPGVPIIFCGLTEEMLDELKLDSHFTGVWAVAQPEETLKAALALQPGTKHVVVVGGVGPYDKHLEAIARGSFHKYEARFEFTYLTDLGMPALIDRLKHLPDHSIVYHTSIMQDAEGARFIDASQSVPIVAGAAHAPVFVVDDVDLGKGTVGGYLLSFATIGQTVAQMAVRVLNGEKPQDIPIVKSANVYMFDWRALQRWGLKESNLPRGSIVLNRQPTMWESYKWYIIAGITLILLETLLIFGLVWQRERRRRSEKQLRESEQRFRLVANTAPVLIWMSGADKLGNYFNQPWLDFTGRSIDAELGDGWAEMVHPEDLQECLEAYKGAFDRRERFEMQYRLRRHDGEYRWLSDIGVPRFDSDGSFVGYIGSCIDVTDRKLAEKAMTDIGRRLIEAHEEERTWIGRELHDDINQRIALAVIELEQWREELSKSGVVMQGHGDHIKQRLTDLGNDVQALSHRLHSSKLDYLGLTVAASSFCRELSEQQKVEIDFTHEGMASSVPKEISLCLFRVLQEALQNAVKYSRVKHFSVRLQGTSAEIQLTIGDLGVGFDQENAASGRGLGLISMRERMQLVNGKISITSQPGGGTTVCARVPFKGEQRAASLAG